MKGKWVNHVKHLEERLAHGRVQSLLLLLVIIFPVMVRTGAERSLKAIYFNKYYIAVQFSTNFTQHRAGIHKQEAAFQRKEVSNTDNWMKAWQRL